MREKYLGSHPRLLGGLSLTRMNFVVLSTDASPRRQIYSNLSITTTSRLLSGLVIAMSLQVFKEFRALTRALGGLEFLRSM